MKLEVGERLEGIGPAQQPGGYVVTSIVRETPWHVLYAGKKIFYNFDFTAKRVRETDDVEWLDVFLRTNRYPILDDPTYVLQRRALARAEVRAILGNRLSNLWPEPLDLLEIENTRDPFAFSLDGERDAEPIVVFTRPQGRFTGSWQQQILPVSSILAVLAELLEFLKQAHAEGLLLLGLSPASLLIDDSNRVHYVGTEMVLSQQSALLKDTTPADVWHRLFPVDRFARGYAAPECFEPGKRPDARADLYAWGTLAFSLLTGIDLGKVAQDQGRPWATLDESHWRELEKLLAQLPANNVQTWAEQVGIAPQPLLDAWPRKLIAGFRMLLSHDAARRPRSVDDLLASFVDPPPPPVAGFLALHTDADTAKLLIDCTGLDLGLEMTIQCARRVAPQQPADGATVAEGPLRPVVGIGYLPITDDPIFYTVFTRQKKGDYSVYSPGVSAQLWQPTDTNLRHWVEEQAATAYDSQPMPTRVSMALSALDTQAVIDGLLPSASPRVRAWALRRIELSLQTQGYSQALETFLRRFMVDPNVELREAAAVMLWTFHPAKTDDVLLRLVETQEALPSDSSIPLMHLLRRLQVPEDRAHAIQQRLESQRPTACPLCHKPLTLGERGPHLQAEHGYITYEGDLLPADAVIARRWERVLQQQDRTAHEDLAEMYLNMPEARRNSEAAAGLYIIDLRRFFLGETTAGDAASTIPAALPFALVVAYQHTLRQSKLFLPIVRQLFDSPHRRLRELGVQTAVAHLQEQLSPRSKVEDLRRLLNAFGADMEYVQLHLELCRQLAQLGVEQALVKTCIAQLQEERLIVCDECGAAVQAKDLDLHMRRAHQIFQFHGVRLSYVETRNAMLKAICTAPPNVAAWSALQSLAEDKHPSEADRYLVVWLYQHIRDGEVEQRGPAIVALAEVLTAANAAPRLLHHFTGPGKNASWELLGQRIALEICIRLANSIPPESIHLVTPFLDNKDLPRRSRENTALALLRSAGHDRTLAVEILHAYVAQSSKKRGIEKLRQLEQRFGHSPALDMATRELEDEVRMSCPRCPTELCRRDMVGHLWDKHRLYLDGERVREPWRVIEDWVVDYGLEKDPQVLLRCRELALRDDPPTGLARLHRALYRHGLRDRDLMQELRGQVKTRKATLCPHCCATVGIDDPPIVQPLNVDESRLQGYGYLLEVSERWLWPSLRVESPDTILHRGREPGRLFTRTGAIFVLIGPLVAATYVGFNWITDHEFPAALIACGAVGVGLCGSGLVYMLWPSARPVKERLIHAAWKLLVPEMLQEDMGRREWSFLNGLVLLTEQARHLPLKSSLLLDCCEEAAEASRTDPVARICLASLCRRYIMDRNDGGEDPFSFILRMSADCFMGKLPLSFLSDLLGNFHGADRAAWSKRDLHRLPILIAQQAFTAEVEIDDWLNLGRAFPVLSAVLNLEMRWHWLQFHALWQLQKLHPWDNAGPALTVLELAELPGDYDEILTYYPDVLLFVEKANLVIGSKGVWIEGVCVTAHPADAEIAIERAAGIWELQIGALIIRCEDDPRPYLADLKRWLHFYFQDFVPTVRNTARPMTETRHPMWQLNKTTCPECNRALVPCLGDLGVALR